VACFKVISCHLLKGMRRTMMNLSKDSWSSAKIHIIPLLFLLTWSVSVQLHSNVSENHTLETNSVGIFQVFGNLNEPEKFPSINVTWNFKTLHHPGICCKVSQNRTHFIPHYSKLITHIILLWSYTYTATSLRTIHWILTV